MIAFLVMAFMGDGCGFADSPPICTSAAAWTVWFSSGVTWLSAR
jgi:hypothetical protein